MIRKDKIQDMGMKSDMLQRNVLSRHDTLDRRMKVSTARQFIYGQQYAVDTLQVEEFLKSESLVPTVVRIFRFRLKSVSYFYLCRTHFQSDSVRWALICF